MNNVFKKWGQEGCTSGTFLEFAAKELDGVSVGACICLNADQAHVLAEIIDSFVEKTVKRHNSLMSSISPTAAAAHDLAEIGDMYATIDVEVKRAADEFKGMSLEDVKNVVQNGNSFLRTLKQLLMGSRFDAAAEELEKYLPPKEADEAKVLFSCKVKVQGESMSPPISVDDYLDAVSLSNEFQSATVSGIIDSQLDKTDGLSSRAEVSEMCVQKGLLSPINSFEETLLKKLTALSFFLEWSVNPNGIGSDDLTYIPIVAIAAAKSAIECIVSAKSTVLSLKLYQVKAAFDEATSGTGEEVR